MLQPNAIKLSVKIQNWPFLSVDNFLGIVTNSTFDMNEKIEVEKNTDERGSLLWVNFIIRGISLYLFHNLFLFVRITLNNF